MKTSHIIIAALTIALAIVTYRLVATTPVQAQKEADGKTDATTSATIRVKNYPQTIAGIMTRSSVRSYTDCAISDGQIDTLLRAAMAAPTARDCRPWKFVVIRDRDVLDSIASHYKDNKGMSAHTPIAIVVCGDMEKAMEGDGRDFWIQDCSAATENLLVAANAMGLGTVWCGVYPIKERVEYISTLLKLPDTLIPLNFIPIGYPAGTVSPKDKYDKSRIVNI